MRINKLDGLRGIFSLMVVFYHIGEAYLPPYLYNNFIFRESNLFVDFFFVLSGYVISLNYHSSILSGNDLLTFIKKRFIRIYPLLLYTTLLFLFFFMLGKYVFKDLINNEKSIRELVLLTCDTLLLTNSTPILGSKLGMNYPSWSISSEMISYFIFGLICLYFRRSKLVLFVAFIFLSFTILLISGKYFTTGNLGFLRGLLCFNLGYVVFVLSEKKFSINNNVEWILPFLIFGLMYVLNILDETTKEIFGIFTIPFLFSLSILTLLKTDGNLSRFLMTKPIAFLGKISYSVYLNHGLILIVFPKLFLKVFHFSDSPISKIIVMLLTIGTIVFYSYLTNKYIENKFSKILKHKLLRTVSV
jgi:peptidoglycan/LPS O-acetylase OafA/YrhL